MKPTLDPQIIMAVSLDAGNRNAKKHGRSKWNVDDYNTAVDESNRLWKIYKPWVPRSCKK